jgi:hypothetical protein
MLTLVLDKILKELDDMIRQKEIKRLKLGI